MKTRHLSPLQLTRPAPRNPVAPAARGRRAGSHRASSGALRQQARHELRLRVQAETHTSPTWHRHSP
jgi:hypothetical protein